MEVRRGPPRADVEIMEKSTCYQGFFQMEKYRLRHRLYSGEMGPEISRELFERGHAAAVLLYDPALDVVVLLEQFRIGALQDEGGPWLLEVVAGMIEEGESPEGVALREAREESGCHVVELVHICDYMVSPGGTSERISLYCGRVDSRAAGGIHGLDAEDEDILVRAVPYAEAWSLLEQGQINSASPIIAMQWLALNRVRLRDLWLEK